MGAGVGSGGLEPPSELCMQVLDTLRALILTVLCVTTHASF